tara:strand:+ start:1915 stop:2130 length:216 start_codon:yes stop_codon:yes gene_type:complete
MLYDKQDKNRPVCWVFKHHPESVYDQHLSFKVVYEDQIRHIKKGGWMKWDPKKHELVWHDNTVKPIDSKHL